MTEAQVSERKQAGEENICPKCGADVSASGDENDKDESETGGSGDKAEAMKETASHAAEAAKAKLKQAFEAGRSDPTVLAKFIDVIMQKLSGMINVSKSGACTSLTMKLGQYATLIFAVFSLVMGVVLTVRLLSFIPLVQGLFLFFAVILAQHCAAKTFTLLDDVPEKCPSTLSGQAIVDIQAVLALACSLFCIAMVANAALTLGGVWSILFLSGLALFFLVLAAVLMNPEELNAKVNAKGGLTEQAVGIAAYQAKAMVKMAPFTYGILGTLAACGLSWNLIKMVFLGSSMNVSILVIYAFIYLILIFSPLLIYLSTLVTFVFIDLIKHLTGIKK